MMGRLRTIRDRLRKRRLARFHYQGAYRPGEVCPMADGRQYRNEVTKRTIDGNPVGYRFTRVSAQS